VVQAADFGPDLYSIQKSSDGTQRLIQAFTADGQLLWQQTVLGPLTDNSVPDAFGGLLTTAVCDPANPSGVAAAINDEDGLTGASLWSIQLASGVGVCPSGVPKMAIRQDGAVVVAGPLQTANPLLVVDGQSGTVLLAPAIPPSTLTNSSGQSSSCDCFTPVGQPMVDSDGSTYVEYEVRQLDSRGATSASSILWLLKIAPDGTTSTTQLSASNNANLFPGNIIPDGQGGVLATWTVDVPFGPPGPHLYQAANVFPGGGLNHYDLPMAPMQLMVDTTTGLPINPPLVLGENGTAFVSYGTNVVSFNVSSGAVNWNYQAPSQTALSLVAAISGGALLAGSTDNIGTQTISLFDALGQPASSVGGFPAFSYSWSSDWYAIPASTVFASISGTSYDLANSDWTMPEGSPSQNGASTKPVASQTRAAIAALAAKNIGSTNWLDSPFNKCNLFVHDMLEQVGITPPLSDAWGLRRMYKYLKGEVDTFHYPALAGDWANTRRTMQEWKQVAVPVGAPPTAFSSDYAGTGDVIAEAIQYSDATGHVGIVASIGHTISADSAVSCYAPPAQAGTITDSDYGFRPDGWVDPAKDSNGQPCRKHGYKRYAVVKRFFGQ
jgi:PQQ-like domain